MAVLSPEPLDLRLEHSRNMTNDSKDSTELNEIRTSIEKSSIKDLDNVNQEQAAYFSDFATKDEEWVEYKNKKLLRKVDAHLLPLLILMYLFNFLDRSNLAQARQGTLEADLGMKGTDFNLATSIFFIGYLLMQLPSNMIITRVRPSLYLAAATTVSLDEDLPIQYDRISNIVISFGAWSQLAMRECTALRA